MALITTIYATEDNPTGLKDSGSFIKKVGFVDNDNENTTWTEYWDEGVLVHRSAHVTLKKPAVFAGSAIGSFQ